MSQCQDRLPKIETLDPKFDSGSGHIKDLKNRYSQLPASYSLEDKTGKFACCALGERHLTGLLYRVW